MTLPSPKKKLTIASISQFECIEQLKGIDRSKFECMITPQRDETLTPPFLLTYSNDPKSRGLLNIDVAGMFTFGYALRTHSMTFLQAGNRFGHSIMSDTYLPRWIGEWSYAALATADEAPLRLNSSLFVQVLKKSLVTVAERISLSCLEARPEKWASNDLGNVHVRTTLRLRGDANGKMSVFFDIESRTLDVAFDMCALTLSSDTMGLVDSYTDPGAAAVVADLAALVEQSLRRALVVASIVDGVSANMEHRMRNILRHVSMVNGTCCSCGDLLRDLVKCRKCQQFCTCIGCIDKGREHVKQCDGTWAIEVPISMGIL